MHLCNNLNYDNVRVSYPLMTSFVPINVPAQDCLHHLTRWLNILISGKAHPLLAPWVCGAPLIALVKPGYYTEGER